MTQFVTLTATGRYYVVYVDDVRTSQHTTEREASQRAINEKLTDITADVSYRHEYEVVAQVTTAGVTLANDYTPVADQPPTILSTPVVDPFVQGTDDTRNLSVYVSDDGLSPVTYNLTNVLNDGLSFDQNTGILSYDGIAEATLSQHTLIATDAVGSAESALFDIEVTGVPAADHIIPASASERTWDASHVAPGEIIELAAGRHGKLQIINVVGTAANRITIRNEPGQLVTVMPNSSQTSSFVWRIEGKHFTLDGHTYAPTGSDYGFVVQVDMNLSPTPNMAGLYFRKWSTDYTCRGVEINGQWPRTVWTGVKIGISSNDASVAPGNTTNWDFGGFSEKGSNGQIFWRENILVEHCYVHDVSGEGLYMGPNYFTGGEFDDGLPLRNIEVRYCLVEDTGRNFCDMKSQLEGYNHLHHCIGRRSGLRGVPGNEPDLGANSQGQGFDAFEGTCNFYNNWVEDAGHNGIGWTSQDRPSSFGPLTCEAYNNVIIDCGQLGNGNANGINCFSSSGNLRFIPTFYNNTIIRAEATGINTGGDTTGALVYDNIICESGGSSVSISGTSRDNETGSVASQNFEDAGNDDFHLTANTPTDVRNNAAGPSPSTDYDDNTRDANPDKGAYEYIP